MGKRIHPAERQFIALGTTARTWAKRIVGVGLAYLGWLSHYYFDKGHDPAAVRAAAASGAAIYAALIALVLAYCLPHVAKEAFTENPNHARWRQAVARTSGQICCGMTAAMIGWMLLLACQPLLHVGNYLSN